MSIELLDVALGLVVGGLVGWAFGAARRADLRMQLAIERRIGAPPPTPPIELAEHRRRRGR